MWESSLIITESSSSFIAASLKKFMRTLKLFAMYVYDNDEFGIKFTALNETRCPSGRELILIDMLHVFSESVINNHRKI